MARPFLAFATALVLCCAAAGLAPAQSLSERLAGDRLGAIEPGTYEAGSGTQFSIDHYGHNYLLRFAGDPEVFVLYADHASLGGRVLKYDSGKTAMQVTGWGGVTLYTDTRPEGLPATRAGDTVTPHLADISLDAVKAAAAGDAQYLGSAHRLSLSFNGDWDRLAADAPLRALFFDAMQNAVRGIDRFAAEPGGQKALAGKVQTVFVTGNGKPTLERKGKQLIVTFDPSRGFAGRASSRAIAHALHTIFRIPRR